MLKRKHVLKVEVQGKDQLSYFPGLFLSSRNNFPERV